MQKKIKNIIVAVTLVVIATAPACGYHLSGTGGIVPQGVKTLSVPVFFNATNEPYVDVDVTQAVVEEFLTDGRLKVVSLEDADLALRGKVTTYEVIPLSYNPQSYVQQYRVRMVVEAVLEDLRSKKILWRERGIEANFISEYSVSYDPTGKAEITLTKNAKDVAIKNASMDIAQTLRSRVLEGF
ncbi:MAG TPA: LptE family protein [Nitrospirota bacterium]|nr:LptE family protein [Nitrospirota bacterium]